MVATTNEPKKRTKPGELERTQALYAALAGAAGDAAAVEKDGTNDHDGYRFTSAERIIIEVKPLLAKHGLGIVPIANRMITDGAACKVEVRWLLTHKDGGSIEITHEWPVVVEPGRPLDKAVASARTASLGYLERDLLQLPRVEEGTGLDDPARSRARAGGQRGSGGSRPTKAEQGEDARTALYAELRRLGVAEDHLWTTVMKVAGKTALSLPDMRGLAKRAKAAAKIDDLLPPAPAKSAAE